MLAAEDCKTWIGGGRPRAAAQGVATSPGDGVVERVEHAGCADDGVQGGVFFEYGGRLVAPRAVGRIDLWQWEVEGEADPGGQEIQSGPARTQGSL
ncbi:hypothetical protein AB0M39_39865 [Streptomyces sp. NPDC051907]|uniref:hypothetical protein n=1 Tax=Streptomyces sp. NPDC051907 TaxID=3155284 RepID=UPI00343404B1